jgi:magnesium transporter
MNAAAQKLAGEFLQRYPQKATETFEDLSLEAQAEVLNSLEPHVGAKLFKKTKSDILAATIPQQTRFVEMAQIADPSDLSRALMRMPEGERKVYLDKLPSELAKEIVAIATYPADSAGSLMEARVHLFHPEDQVGEAIEKLRHTSHGQVSSLYLVDFDGVLVGRVSLQDLIGAEDDTKLKDISKTSPWVNEMAPKDEIVEVVEKNKVPSVPVLNSQNVIIGVIRYEQLVTIVHQDALDDIQKMVGVSKDERALSSPLFSVKKRLPWLSINLVTTFVAAFVVGMFEDTIAKITALAVLLPVVAGQSGNTGAQAQAITMRGLALREIRLRHKWRVLWKEGAVGFVNGAAIGILCMISVYFWSQSLPLAGVIGVSMVFAMVAASLSGAAVPMILTALGQDPATSSSIILTTITDIVGFLSFLGLATIFGSYLV